MSEERRHRPPLERTEPDRGIGNIFGSSEAPQSSVPPSSADGLGEEAFEAAGDFVGDGVRVAYEVVEAYMRQGQQVAQQLGKLSYGPMTLAGNLPELQTRWMQLWTDMAAGCFDLLGLWTEAMVPFSGSPQGRDRGPLGGAAPPGQPQDMPPVPQAPPAPPAPPPPTSAAPSQAPSVRFAYEVASARPALVHAELYPGREVVDILPTALRCAEHPAESIEVVFEPRPEQRRVLVRVAVPRDQQPGLYTGALVCTATDTMVGGISLRLR